MLRIDRISFKSLTEEFTRTKQCAAADTAGALLISLSVIHKFVPLCIACVIKNKSSRDIVNAINNSAASAGTSVMTSIYPAIIEQGSQEPLTSGCITPNIESGHQNI